MSSGRNVSVVACGIGNVQSVANAIARTGAQPLIATDGDEIKRQKADCIVLPGVGAIGDALNRLRSTGLDTALEDLVWEEGVPLLGICVGMQIMAETCTEFGMHKGMGWIPGEVKRVAPEGSDVRVPHVGWNTLEVKGEEPLLSGIAAEHYYFVHSFAMTCPEEFVTARTEYSAPFVSAVRRDHVAGVQFHPEKSSVAGERLLANFVNG